jgi:hypothetical protein
MTQPPYPGDPGQSYPPQPGWPGQAAQPQQPSQGGWAQQPTQAVPQNWGQQPTEQAPAAPAWGQQPPTQQQPTTQWGATAYGQQQAVPQYAATSSVGTGSGFDLNSAWPLLATALAALVAVIFIWAGPWATTSIHPTVGAGLSASMKPLDSDTGYSPIWVILFMIVGIVAVITSAAAAFVRLPVLKLVVPIGALLAAIFVGVELLYLNSKIGGAKSLLQSQLQQDGGGSGSIHLGWGAWAALALAIIALGTGILAFLRSRSGGDAGAAAYGTGYPTATPSYGTQQAWGQQPQAQPQWGQPGDSGAGAQPQWGQQPGQPPQQPQWGQQPGQQPGQQWGQQPPQQ